MYRLTPRMLQRLERDFRKYHELFSGSRCSGWEQEELIVAAINSDTVAEHHPRWTEAGHDADADIRVRADGMDHSLQIKSGKLSNGYLVLSGHRLGRFNGNMKNITTYLNSNSTEIIAVPYKKIDDERGLQHVYQVSYIDANVLTGVDPDDWHPKGTSCEQTTGQGVKFTIRPSMSWQVWWEIPIRHIRQEEPFVIR